MDYNEAVSYLYSQLPMFSRTGAAAYKPGLQTSEALDRFFGHPHTKFKSIHVAGTNGKGSTSHTIASVLQQQGYKTGLYTSPHLVDFRERIKVDGEMIPREAVTDFVERFLISGYEGHPSFFELTMMMAFDWFARSEVDYAVIEVGMGGRLDSTNIITPIGCIITNISKDHTQFLGDTLEKIAGEKAGIIKSGIPVTIGEKGSDTVASVFKGKASEVNAPIRFAEDDATQGNPKHLENGGWQIHSEIFGDVYLPLDGDYQQYNFRTVLTALEMLRETGVKISTDAVREGISGVVKNTALAGRWMKVGEHPLMICDTGHNEAGIRSNMQRLAYWKERHPGGRLHIVVGFVADKDVKHILPLFPKDATYYFTQAAIPRAMKVNDLRQLAGEAGYEGKTFNEVKNAVRAARNAASPEDMIYIGGSTFIVADYLATL